MSIRNFDYSREYRGVDTERPPLQPSIVALNAEIAGRNYSRNPSVPKKHSFGALQHSGSGQRYDPVADLIEADGQSSRGLSRYVDDVVQSSFTSPVRLGTQPTTPHHSIARGREEGFASEDHQRTPLRTPPIIGSRGGATPADEALSYRGREYPPSLLTRYLSSAKGASEADNRLSDDQTASSSMRWHGIPINSKMAPFAGPMHSFSAGHLAARLSPPIIAAGESVSVATNRDAPTSLMLTAADGEGGVSSEAVMSGFVPSRERERKLYERDLENFHRQQAAAKERLRRTVEEYSARQMEYEAKSESEKTAPSVAVETILKDSTDVVKAMVPLTIPTTVSSPLRLMRATTAESVAPTDKKSASLLDAMLGERAANVEVRDAAYNTSTSHARQTFQSDHDQKGAGEDAQKVSQPPSSVYSGLRVFVGRGGNLPVAEMGVSGQPIQLTGDFAGPTNTNHVTKPQVPLMASPPRDGRGGPNDDSFPIHQPSATKVAREKTISLPKPANYRTAKTPSESQTRRSASATSSSLRQPAGRPSAKQHTENRLKDQNHQDSTVDRAFAAFLYVESDRGGIKVAKASSREEKHRETSRSRSRSTSKGTRHAARGTHRLSGETRRPTDSDADRIEADEFAGLEPPPNSSSRQIALLGLGELEAMRKQARVHRGRKESYNARSAKDQPRAMMSETNDKSQGSDWNSTAPAHYRRDYRRLSITVSNGGRTSTSPVPHNPHPSYSGVTNDVNRNVHQYAQRPTIDEEGQQLLSESAVVIEVHNSAPVSVGHVVATAEEQLTSDTEAARSAVQSNDEVSNRTEKAHVTETTKTAEAEEKDDSYLNKQQQQLLLQRAQQESYNKAIRDAIEAAANAAKLSSHIRGKREEYTENESKNDSAVSDSYGLNHSKTTLAVLRATSNTHQSPPEHRIDIGDLCALPELRKAVMAFAKEVLLAEIKALTRLREKGETTAIPSTSPMALLSRQEGFLTEGPPMAGGAAAAAADEKATNNTNNTESKDIELTSPDRYYSFLRQSLGSSPTKSDRAGNEFLNRFDGATQRLIVGPEEGNDASLGAVVKSEGAFAGDLGRYLGDTPEGVRSGAAFSDVVCSQILASVVTAFTERHTVLTTRLPLSTSLQGEIVLLVRKEMLKASVSYGKHVEEPFLFGSVSRSGAVVGGQYPPVTLKSPVIDATNAFAEKNKIMRALDVPPAAGQRGNAVWIAGKSYAKHTAVEAGTARNESTKDAPFVFSQPVSVTAFKSGGAFPSYMYSALNRIVDPDEDLRRSSNIPLQHPAAVAIAADLAMNNATVVISEPTFTYGEDTQHKKEKAESTCNLVSNKPWKTIVIVASVNRELDATASPPLWSLSLGNQYAAASANAIISAAVVPVDQLVHLRVASTSQVLKTRDQSVFVLELLPGSVRRGHQYTVWFKPTPSSSQTELKTFWVP